MTIQATVSSVTAGRQTYLDRVARSDADQHSAVAFVLQGGGSLAAGQIGMLRALTEAGIEADLVGGSSAGAWNAVAFASTPTIDGIDHLEGMWLNLRRRHIAPLSARALAAGLTGRRDGLFTHDAMRKFLSTRFIADTLSQTTLSVYVVATDLYSGHPVVLSDGDTVTALLASSAFPGLFPPVQVGSQHLVDGGVSADIPILQAETLGATTTYVLPAAVSDDAGWRPRGPLPLAYHALGQVLDATALRDTAAAKGEVNLLPAPRSRASNPLDFRETARLIDDGYRLASSWLATARVDSSAISRER